MAINMTAYMIFSWIAFNLTMAEDIHCGRYFASNKYLSQMFLTFENIGFQQCSKQCLLRSRCLILSYNIPNSTCALGTDQTLLTGTPQSSKHVIRRRSELSAFENVLLKSCAGHSCEPQAICIELPSGWSTCLLECGGPPVIVGAHSPTSPDGGLGSQATYKCKQDHVSSGMPDITCQPDGLWSTPKLSCSYCDPKHFTFEESLNFCYMVEDTILTNYIDARTLCNNIGGKLAKLGSLGKITFVGNLASITNADEDFFVDGNDQSVETNWVHDDGTPVNMTLFHPGRPFIDSTVHDCLVFHIGYKRLADQQCSKLRNFICELTPN